MTDSPAALRVQVCYALPGQIFFREFDVPSGTALREAIMQSGLLHDFTQVDLTQSRVGIYGKLKPLDTEVRAQDRIEIYRPLIADPKESRRQRAEKKAAIKSPKTSVSG